MIGADLDRGELVKELETLRQCVAELEEFQFERQRGEETQPKIEADERYRAILESSDDGLLVLSRRHIFPQLLSLASYNLRCIVYLPNGCAWFKSFGF